jgi:hypothetical protein
MSEAAQPDAPPRRRVLVVIGALMLTMLLAALDQTIVSTALPTIVGDGPAPLLTEPGLVAHDRIVAERQRCLGTLVADWECGEPEVDAMIERLSEELGRLQPLST